MNEFWLSAVEAPTATELEEAIADIELQAPYKLHLRGDFKTRGLTIPSSCQLDLEGATITLDPNAITDDQITSEPLCIISSAMGWARGKSPEDASAAVPRGEAVRGGTLIANHRAVSERWRARGLPYRAWGLALQGHQAAAEGVTFRDFGASKGADKTVSAEAFGVILSGARHPDDVLALPSDLIFEDAQITDCTLEHDDPTASDDQITAFLIMGGFANGRQLFRSSASILSPRVKVAGDSRENRVQAATLYQCLKGRIAGLRAPGANVGVYGDYYSTKGVAIEESDFRGTWVGIQLLLSPTGEGAEGFSHEDYLIHRNQYGSLDVDVDLDTRGPTTDSRFIRGIAIEEGPRVRASKDASWKRIPPTAVLESRRGCNPFR